MLREVELLVQGNSDSSTSEVKLHMLQKGDETWLGVGSGNRVAYVCVCVCPCVGSHTGVVSAVFPLTPKR